MDIQITIENDEKIKTYKITYSKVNKYTNRMNNKTFKYYYGTKKTYQATKF